MKYLTETMMLYETDSDLGKIIFNKAVLGSIIKQEVAATDGKIILCSPKGKPLRYTRKKSIDDSREKNTEDSKQALRKSSDDTGFFDFTWTDGNFHIDLYIIVRLGGSINSLAENLNNNLKNKTTALLGIMPASITANVKGILSKNISQRDIQITQSYT